ncbi:MAG: hypothetical protein KGL39_00080 [Patescibacteria group bacterium]|nr:hypothetical protein [Patescibacteria group bacterium]
MLFDVDETLEISQGPISLSSLMRLRQEGHIVGLCGNLHCFMERVPKWWEYISFTLNFDTLITLGGLLPKEYWLRTFLVSCRNADDYVLVGNRLGVTGASDDEGAVQRSGPPWRFILERDFVDGKR